MAKKKPSVRPGFWTIVSRSSRGPVKKHRGGSRGRRRGAFRGTLRGELATEVDCLPRRAPDSDKALRGAFRGGLRGDLRRTIRGEGGGTPRRPPRRPPRAAPRGAPRNTADNHGGLRGDPRSTARHHGDLRGAPRCTTVPTAVRRLHSADLPAGHRGAPRRPPRKMFKNVYGPVVYPMGACGDFCPTQEVNISRCNLSVVLPPHVALCSVSNSSSNLQTADPYKN